MGIFSKVREKLSGGSNSKVDENNEEYVELGSEEGDDSKSQIIVRPFIIEDFDHIKSIIDTLREGHTIALINIKPLRDKDIIELKRAISKLKKTCDAIEGDIAGFGEDWIAAVPSFAKIYRGTKKAEQTSGAEVKEFVTGEEDL